MSIWNTALNLLARREYSQYELKNKLLHKFSDSAAEIDQVLERLTEQGLQSDERFVDMWLNSQIEKGRGRFVLLMNAGKKELNICLKMQYRVKMLIGLSWPPSACGANFRT